MNSWPCWVNWKDWEPRKGRKNTKITCVAASMLQICETVWFKLTGRHFLNAFHISLVSSEEPQLWDQGNTSDLHQAPPYLNGHFNPDSLYLNSELWSTVTLCQIFLCHHGVSVQFSLHKWKWRIYKVWTAQKWGCIFLIACRQISKGYSIQPTKEQIWLLSWISTANEVLLTQTQKLSLYWHLSAFSSAARN